MAIYERMTIRGRGGALPTYQRQTGAYAPGAGVSARMDDSAARIASAGDDLEARALDRLGETMNRAVQVGVKAYDDYSKSKATQLITQYRRDMNTALYGENGILTQKGEAALDADEQRAERARQLRDELMKDAGEHTKRYFNIPQQYAQTEFTTMQKRNFEAAAEEWAESAIVSYANERDFDKNTGGALHFAQKRLELEGYSGEALQRGLKETSSKIFRGAIESALAGNDVTSARRLLERGSRMHGEGEGAWSRMTADDVAWGKNAIRTRQEALQAKAEAAANKSARELLKGYDDAVSLAEARGDTSQLDAIAGGLRRLGKTDDADNIARKTKLLADTREVSVFAMNQPLPEVKQRIDQLEAEVKAMRSGDASWDAAEYERASKEYDIAVKAYNSRAKAMKNDPAAAVEQSNLFQLPDNATPEDRVSARLAAQERNGLPSSLIKPLSSQEVEGLADQYGKAASPTVFINQVREAYGEQFRLVMKQLVVSGKFPKSMNLIADMNPQAGDLLAQAGRKDFTRQTEEALGMENADKTSLRSSVNDALGEVAGTLIAGGNSDAVVTISSAAYDLALQYRMQGMSPTEAAKKAASEVFSGRYAVTGSYRVPNRFDSDSVSLGAGKVVRDIADSGEVEMIFPDGTGLTPEQKRRRMKSTLEAKGRWITNSDETGLVLTIGGKPVRTKDGQLVMRSFDELQALGASSPVQAVPDPMGAMSLAQGEF